jgi:copper resistance protein C
MNAGLMKMSMGKKRVRLTLCCVAAAVAVCASAALAPRVALAHAVLVSAQPSENSVVTGPDVAVLLKFNSRIDTQHSTLTLRTPDGKVGKVDIGNQSEPGLLSARLTGLLKGAYQLRWQVLAVDGHVTRGTVLFRIK